MPNQNPHNPNSNDALNDLLLDTPENDSKNYISFAKSRLAHFQAEELQMFYAKNAQSYVGS